MKKGELRHIHIEPAHDGTVVTHVHKKVTEGKNKGPWLSDQTEEVHTHPTAEAAGEHVADLLRQHFDKGSKAGKDGAGAKHQGRNARSVGDSRPTSDDGAAENLA